ncbi:MAG: YceI family protein [Acidimicrobiales bacterium]|nr:YceI family protein [Acidimicrobiales bacterium]
MAVEISSPTRKVHGLDLPITGVYVIDRVHSNVEFSVRHLMVSKVRGRFTSFDGMIVIDEEPTASSVSVDIDTRSLETGEPQRDAHLKSADFLDVEHFPTMSYRSQSVRYDPSEKYWDVSGLLTIRGITRPVSLEVEVLGAVFDLSHAVRAGFHVESSFDRHDFGLTWNQPLESGGVLIGRKIELHMDVEAVRQP